MAVQAQLYPERLGLLPFCSSQDCIFNHPVSSTELETDFGFVLQEPHQQHNSLFVGQQNSQSVDFDYSIGGASSSLSTCDDSSLSMALSHFLGVHLSMQSREIDCMLQSQAEAIKSALREQRKQQLGIILKNVESKVSCFVRQKEEDLAKATKKTMELEAILRKAEMEGEQWQRLAKEKEERVVFLSNALEQVRERLALVSNRSQDAESFCCGSCDDHEQEEGKKKMVCKRCNSRGSCVLFLPCRHLCSCKFCEVFLGSCPVCESVKEASIEVLWV